MVLVLWSPVAVPLLPTLVQAWATNTYSGIAEFICIIGLYAAIMILVMLWGRRIRGFEDPLEQYGLDMKSSQKVCIQAIFVGQNPEEVSFTCYDDVLIYYFQKTLLVLPGFLDGPRYNREKELCRSRVHNQLDSGQRRSVSTSSFLC